MPLRILYLADAGGTAAHRAAALRRIGCEVDAIDPRACFGRSRYAEAWIWKAGSFGMGGLVRRYVLSRMRHERYDACIVNHGELVGPRLVRELRQRSGAVINYNADNPFVGRDENRWRLFVKALPYYDLVATPRVSTAEEGTRRGARMHRFVQAADEVVHRPRLFDAGDAARYGADVSFIGTWMPERGSFVVRLLEAGVNVRIFGANWNKAPEYARLAGSIVIPGMLGDEDYVRAIQYAHIALGFVSKENGDLHTNRSVEVPAIGTLLCAQRTDQHLALYDDGKEAVFWSTMDECAERCLNLLANPGQINLIAAAGAERQRRSRNWNQQLMKTILDDAFSSVAVRSAS